MGKKGRNFLAMKLMLTGGGTGGHIYPALSVAKELRKNNAKHEIMYVGTSRGLESKIIPAQNLPFKTIDIRGMPRKIDKDLILFGRDFVRGLLQARRILKEFKPDIVLGTGGYVCGPVVFAAWMKKIPALIHEQNVIPGITNKFLSRLSVKVLLSFEESKKYFPRAKTVVTGNPRASEIHRTNRNDALKALGLDEHKKTLLIVSGSQGAKVINENVLKIINNLLENNWLQIIYITGDRYYDKVNEKIKGEDSKRIIIYPFLNEMYLALASADLVISRAGATTIAEITAFSIPSILIPSPNVTNDHQKLNAKTLAEREAAVLMEENDLTSELLEKNILELLSNEKYLFKMSQEASALGYPRAAAEVLKILEDNIA